MGHHTKQSRQCNRDTTVGGDRCKHTTLAANQDCGRHGGLPEDPRMGSAAVYQAYIDGEIANMMSDYAAIADMISFDSDDWVTEIEESAHKHCFRYTTFEVDQIISDVAFKNKNYDVPKGEYSDIAEHTEAFYRGKRMFMVSALSRAKRPGHYKSDRDICLAVASHPETDAYLLNELAHRRDKIVQQEVLKHPETDSGALSHMSTFGKSWGVRRAARKRLLKESGSKKPIRLSRLS